MSMELGERLAIQKDKHLYRQRYVRSKGVEQGAIFCSNDYLGLSQHPSIIAAFKQAVDDYGVSASSSPMVVGYTDLHQQFEIEFAKFIGSESALLFSCGYMANLGLFTTLADKDTLIFADKYIHASLLDAIQLAKAKLLRFPHKNYAQLQLMLGKYSAEKTFIVTDSVFSMLGDVADMTALLSLSKEYHAPLIVDDAHGLGVLGKRGAGIAEFYQLAADALPILVCPLGKAFGVMGAMVAGKKTIIDAVTQFARTYMYTHALPPALVAAGLASLACVQQETWRRDKLQQLIAYFQKIAKNLSLPLAESITPIQSIIIGSSIKAQAISATLRAEGFILNAMRPPTVPETSACLRVTLSCLHEEKQILQLLTSIQKIYVDLS